MVNSRGALNLWHRNLSLRWLWHENLNGLLLDENEYEKVIDNEDLDKDNGTGAQIDCELVEHGRKSVNHQSGINKGWIFVKVFYLSTKQPQHYHFIIEIYPWKWDEKQQNIWAL